MNIVLVLTGPSGAGKTTYSRMLTNFLGDACGHNVTYTTRKPRKEDIGSSYFTFITEEEYEHLRDDGTFFCCKEFCGNWYGYRRTDLLEVLQSGRDLILDSIMNLSDLKQLPAHVVVIYLTPDTNKELCLRIQNRNPNMDKHEKELRIRDFLNQQCVSKDADYIVDTSASRTKEAIFEDIVHIYQYEKRSLAQVPGNNMPSLVQALRCKEWLRTHTLPCDDPVGN